MISSISSFPDKTEYHADGTLNNTSWTLLRVPCSTVLATVLIPASELPDSGGAHRPPAWELHPESAGEAELLSVAL